MLETLRISRTWLSIDQTPHRKQELRHSPERKTSSEPSLMGPHKWGDNTKFLLKLKNKPTRQEIFIPTLQMEKQ